MAEKTVKKKSVVKSSVHPWRTVRQTAYEVLKVMDMRRSDFYLYDKENDAHVIELTQYDKAMLKDIENTINLLKETYAKYGIGHYDNPEYPIVDSIIEEYTNILKEMDKYMEAGHFTGWMRRVFMHRLKTVIWAIHRIYTERE